MTLSWTCHSWACCNFIYLFCWILSLRSIIIQFFRVLLCNSVKLSFKTFLCATNLVILIRFLVFLRALFLLIVRFNFRWTSNCFLIWGKTYKMILSCHNFRLLNLCWLIWFLLITRLRMFANIGRNTQSCINSGTRFSQHCVAISRPVICWGCFFIFSIVPILFKANNWWRFIIRLLSYFKLTFSLCMKFS